MRRNYFDLRNGHGLLVIPPLLIILLFCFSFVLMNPHAAPGSVTADYTKAAGKGVNLRQPHQLPAVTSVPESKIDPVVTSASPPSGGPSNISTATPQPNRGSTNDLQGGRAAGSNGKITVPAKLRQSINSVNDN